MDSQLPYVYPAHWNELKIKFFEQIKFSDENPQRLTEETVFYLRKFDKYQQKKSWISWNWPVFFNIAIWCSYRRFYSPLALKMCSLFIFGSIIIFSDAVIKDKLGMEILASVITTTALIIGYLSHIFSIPIIANRLYINKVLKRIRKGLPPKAPSWYPFLSFIAVCIFMGLVSLFLEYFKRPPLLIS